MPNFPFHPMDPLGILRNAANRMNTMATKNGLPPLPIVQQQKPKELYTLPSRGTGNSSFLERVR
jgi:hypothetical protein